MNTITNTSESFKLLISFLYSNLAQLAIDANKRVRYITKPNTVRAHDAIKNRWRDANNRADDIGMFLAQKQNYLLELHINGLTEASFEPMTKEAYGIITALVNWKINQYNSEHTKQQTFEGNLIYISEDALDSAINRWENEVVEQLDREHEIEVDNMERIRILEEKLTEFAETLSPEEKIVWSYMRFPGKDDLKREQLNDACIDLNIQKRQFFRRAERLHERFVNHMRSYAVSQ